MKTFNPNQLYEAVTKNFNSLEEMKNLITHCWQYHINPIPQIKALLNLDIDVEFAYLDNLNRSTRTIEQVNSPVFYIMGSPNEEDYDIVEFLVVSPNEIHEDDKYWSDSDLSSFFFLREYYHE